MILKALGFFLLSSVKFAVAVIPIALSYSFVESLIISISGGVFGAFFFLFVWARVLEFWNIHIRKKEKNTVKPFTINKKKRKMIRIKNSYGYWGIVITTPLLLSIPLGAFLLMQYYKNRNYKFLHLSVFIVIWAFVLVSLFKFFQISL